MAVVPDENQDYYTLLDVLLAQLPENARWTSAHRQRWLAAMTACIDLLMTIIDPDAPEASRMPALPPTASQDGQGITNGATRRTDEQTAPCPSTGKGREVQGARLLYESVLESAIAVLEAYGSALYINELLPLVEARRGTQSKIGLQGVLYKALQQEDTRLIKVAPLTFGVKGRDGVSEHRSQGPRPKGINRREGEPHSKQAKWQDKNREAGRCVRCGQDSAPYALCPAHRESMRTRRAKAQLQLVEEPAPTASPSVPGARECLKCDRSFVSPDRVRIRLCPTCRGEVSRMELEG